ncbi:MAG: 16S rRNA (adenine(1518)-N(6)/adenine(1519)-N(6))-dimethyltransferase RsmA [Solitalea-like symbiont of Acarus siro]
MVRAKKKFGQHFLINKQISQQIVRSLVVTSGSNILEIGPGTGALTEYILNIPNISIYLIDIDLESINYLKDKFKIINNNILYGNFLEINLQELFKGRQVSIIGNFPYNISSQIIFTILDQYKFVNAVVGTFQYEVAERISSGPNSKKYGIISVLTQVYYDASMLFAIGKENFYPQPKVESAVIKLVRREKPLVDEQDWGFFKQLVKASFLHRRKTLRNNLKIFDLSKVINKEILNLRAENLSLEDYINLAKILK